MPTYDYRCEANGQIIEVNHRMNETLACWGEVCKYAAIDPGDIPADSPVTRLATGGQVVTSTNLGSGSAPACETGGPCCGAGLCGLN